MLNEAEGLVISHRAVVEQTLDIQIKIEGDKAWETNALLRL